MHPLQRTLTLHSVVLFGLVYMTPIIMLATFGILADATHGVVSGAYALALLAMALLIPVLGAAADLWLMVSLDKNALTLGVVWLVLGVVYLTVLTGGFKQNPPEMDFSEAA